MTHFAILADIYEAPGSPRSAKEIFTSYEVIEVQIRK